MRRFTCGFTSLLLFSLVGFACKKGTTASQDQQHSKASTWDPQGVNVAAFFVENDFNGLVDESGSILKKSDLPLVAHVAFVVTAEQYEADFDANEIAADTKYRAKKILLYATVQSINKDATGSGYFTLFSSTPVGVQAQLSDLALDKAATEKRNDKVVLVCDPGTRIAGFATLGNCLYLNQYLAVNHLSPDDQVRNFFQGRVALPYDEFTEALWAYALGMSPLIPRQCPSNPSIQTCDVSKWDLDKTSSEKLHQSLDRTMTSYRQNTKLLFKHVSCLNSEVETPDAIAGSPGTCLMVRNQ